MTVIEPRNAEEFALSWRHEHRGFPAVLMLGELKEKFGFAAAREAVRRLELSEYATARFEKLKNKLREKL